LTGTKSAEFGQRLQKALVENLKLPDRGIKDGTVPGSRLAEVVQTKATAVLTELFFHDNTGDIARFKERRLAVMEAIARVVCEWFGIKYSKPVTLMPMLDKLKIYVGDVTLEGFLIDNQAYAPVRALIEAMERKVNWDSVSKTVTIK
jgi:hypothetical protein